MTADIAREIRALEDMTVDELKRRWAEVFGEEAPNSHPRYLVKRLAWRIQANADLMPWYPTLEGGANGSTA